MEKQILIDFLLEAIRSKQQTRRDNRRNGFLLIPIRSFNQKATDKEGQLEKHLSRSCLIRSNKKKAADKERQLEKHISIAFPIRSNKRKAAAKERQLEIRILIDFLLEALIRQQQTRRDTWIFLCQRHRYRGRLEQATIVHNTLRETTLVQNGGLRRNSSYAEEDSPGMCLTMSLLYLIVKYIAGTRRG